MDGRQELHPLSIADLEYPDRVTVACIIEAGDPQIYNLTLAFIVALIVNVIVSLLTPDKADEQPE